MIPSSRGRNYAAEELKQVCCSVLYVSQDPVVGNGQRSEKFWERVKEHYQQNKPRGAESRAKKSLESKWGDIKHDVAKFCGVYQQVEELQVSGTNKEDTLVKAHELYKQNHPKNRAFTFENCFWILKDVPRWGHPGDEMSAGKRSRSSLSNGVIDQQNSNGTPPTEDADLSDSIQAGTDETPVTEVAVERKRPGGNKKAKEDSKRQKFDQEALRASMKAAENLEKMNAERNYCTQINTMMRLIMMPTSSLNPGMRAFAEEFQLEEAQKLRAKMREQAPQPGHTAMPPEQAAPREASPVSPINAATVGEYYMPDLTPQAELYEQQRDPLAFHL